MQLFGKYNLMKPLENVRILAVEQYGAGPIGTSYLVELGAEVIKIESPDGIGDVARGVGPHYIEKGEESDDSLFFQGLNLGKKSLVLNLKLSKGREIFGKLVKSADALISNMRGDVPDRLGLTYETLKNFNPKIVCAHLTGYGRDNERSDWPGYDYMMQAEAGYFYLTGEPYAPPTRFGLSMIDFTTGVTTALALVSALNGALRTNQGRDIDVSLFDVALYNLNYLAMWSLNADAQQERVPRSAHFALTPCQLYKTLDGWIYVMCNKEKFWKNLCTQIGRTDLATDPRFADYPSRLSNRDVLTEILDKALSSKPTEQWMNIFKTKVPAAPVLKIGEAMANPFLEKTQRIRTTASGNHAGVRYVKNPIRYDGELESLSSAPKLGEHTEELLREVGVSSAEFEQLKKDGVIS